MTRGQFEVQGVTPHTCIHRCDRDFIKEICETDTVTIPCQDPDIQEIVRVNVHITLRSFKIIDTPLGKKLVIHAIKTIEVIFKAEGIRFTTALCVPFVTCILLECHAECVETIKFVIEDIDAIQINLRSVAVSTVILVVPEFCGGNHDCDLCHTHGHNHSSMHDCSCSTQGKSIRCDIKIKPGRQY